MANVNLKKIKEIEEKLSDVVGEGWGFINIPDHSHIIFKDGLAERQSDLDVASRIVEDFKLREYENPIDDLLTENLEGILREYAEALGFDYYQTDEFLHKVIDNANYFDDIEEENLLNADIDIHEVRDDVDFNVYEYVMNFKYNIKDAVIQAKEEYLEHKGIINFAFEREEGKLYSFDKEKAKEIIRDLSANKGENATSWIPLANVTFHTNDEHEIDEKVQFALVFGWEDGFDPEDKENIRNCDTIVIESDGQTAWGLCGKIASVPNNSMMHEYTYDWEMPISENFEVWDTDTHISTLSEKVLDNLLDWYEKEWNEMIDVVLSKDNIEIDFIDPIIVEEKEDKEEDLER